MRGKISCFCRSEPKRINAGPTVFTVTNGNGASAHTSSSSKIFCACASNPRPPYSTGQPGVSQPSRPIWRMNSR